MHARTHSPQSIALTAPPPSQKMQKIVAALALSGASALVAPAAPRATVKVQETKADLEALDMSGAVPSVNQRAMSVTHHDDESIAYCQGKGIVFESYFTLKGCPWNNADVKTIAASHNVSVSQVCLRYVLDRGGAIAAAGAHDHRMPVPEPTIAARMRPSSAAPRRAAPLPGADDAIVTRKTRPQSASAAPPFEATIRALAASLTAKACTSSCHAAAPSYAGSRANRRPRSSW